ncbi:DUF3577 domain-containing protein [Paraburkholderia sp. WSM4179]|uniref:DUF3577 domain-containing protein n=1 Tax=Paraburkholderia sp. WSM4179 TaxID=2991073 RepID=UPI0032B0006B
MLRPTVWTTAGLLTGSFLFLPVWGIVIPRQRAKEAVRAVTNDANDPDVKVLVSFRAGDHYIRTFERTGNRAGETGAVLKGRLLKLFWIKVDGQEVYRDESDREDDDAEAGADTSAETINGHEPSTSDRNRDRRDTPPAEGPANSRDIGASSNDAAAAERTNARSNRYPPLRRHANGSARRPSANAE